MASFWKKLGKILAIVVVVAAVVFSGGAIAAVAAGLGTSTVVAGAIYGAAVGAVTGGLWTGTVKGAVKGALVGGLIGGAAGFAGVGSPGGALGSGIGAGGAPVAAAPSVAAPAVEAAASVTPVAPVPLGANYPALPQVEGMVAAAPKAAEMTAAEAILASGKESGKYMLYAKGIEVGLGGLSSASAAKTKAEETAVQTAKEDELKANRNYQPDYPSTTTYAGPRADRPRISFGPPGLIETRRP